MILMPIFFLFTSTTFIIIILSFVFCFLALSTSGACERCGNGTHPPAFNRPIFVYLNEYCLKIKKQIKFTTKFVEYPIYSFQTEAAVEGGIKGSGKGRSKKISKDNASLDVLIQLSISEPECLAYLKKCLEKQQRKEIQKGSL